jgi:hypothetical protein
MTNTERLAEIKKVFSEIIPLEKEWNLKGIKIKADKFRYEEEKATIEIRWNELDIMLYPLYKKLRELQSVYDVEFSHEKKIELVEMTMNLKVEVNTYLNGWNIYNDHEELNNLLVEIRKFLREQGYIKPDILNIKNKD